MLSHLRTLGVIEGWVKIYGNGPRDVFQALAPHQGLSDTDHRGKELTSPS